MTALDYNSTQETGVRPTDPDQSDNDTSYFGSIGTAGRPIIMIAAYGLNKPEASVPS